MIPLGIERQYPFTYLSMTFEYGIEIWYAIIVDNAHIGKELREILRVIDNRIAWSLGSGNILCQDVFGDKVLYVTYGGVFGTLSHRSPGL